MQNHAWTACIYHPSIRPSVHQSIFMVSTATLYIKQRLEKAHAIIYTTCIYIYIYIYFFFLIYFFLLFIYLFLFSYLFIYLFFIMYAYLCNVISLAISCAWTDNWVNEWMDILWTDGYTGCIIPASDPKQCVGGQRQKILYVSLPIRGAATNHRKSVYKTYVCVFCTLRISRSSAGVMSPIHVLASTNMEPLQDPHLRIHVSTSLCLRPLYKIHVSGFMSQHPCVSQDPLQDPCCWIRVLCGPAQGRQSDRVFRAGETQILTCRDAFFVALHRRNANLTSRDASCVHIMWSREESRPDERKSPRRFSETPKKLPSPRFEQAKRKFWPPESRFLWPCAVKNEQTENLHLDLRGFTPTVRTPQCATLFGEL